MSYQVRDGSLSHVHTIGKWVYGNNDNWNEGGNDYYWTKAEALYALRDYIKHRVYIKPYGWCYVPDKN